MELVLEFIFDLIIEGSVELGSNRRVPLWVRIISTIVFLAFYLGVIGLFLFLGVDLLKEGSTAGAIFFFVFAIAFSVFVIITIRKKYLEHNQDR